mmetsp:Transcript_12348/g.32099  ORF Transcript_12348/g.32099 Transcript_12348/m.32099 type:complete len:193 (-) Transcript_12348:59-637(-)
MGPPLPPPVAPTPLGPLLPSSPLSLPPGAHLVVPGNGTLQAALKNSSSGDELLLADGIYTGAELIIVWNVTIRAQNVGQVTVDGEQSHRVITIEAGTINLYGLTIANGNAGGVRAHTDSHPLQPSLDLPRFKLTFFGELDTEVESTCTEGPFTPRIVPSPVTLHAIMAVGSTQQGVAQSISSLAQSVATLHQ